MKAPKITLVAKLLCKCTGPAGNITAWWVRERFIFKGNTYEGTKQCWYCKRTLKIKVQGLSRILGEVEDQPGSKNFHPTSVDVEKVDVDYHTQR